MLKNVPRPTAEMSPRRPARSRGNLDVAEETLDQVNFSEDARSPSVADESREQSKGERMFKKGLNRLLHSTQAYADAGRAFAKATAALGNDLQEFSGIDWMTGQQLSQHVAHVGHLMRTLSAAQEKTMVSVLDALDVPVFQLLELEQQEVRSLADARSRAEDAASKQKKKGAMPKTDDENAAIDRSVSQARTDLELQMAILDGSRTIKVARFLRSLVSAEEEFFAMSNHGMQEAAQHVEKLDVDLAELEAAHTKRGVRDGYVWKLSHKSNKWKRVWLVLRQGQLEMRQDKKKEGGRPVGRRMNLLISTVRVPMVKPGVDDASSVEKFEFEIVTPERKRGWMFAVKSDEERQAWIEALQSSIGSLINNQQLHTDDGGAMGGSGNIESIRKSNRNGGKEGLGRVIRKVIPGKGHRKTRSVTSAETARAMAMSLMNDGGDTSVMAELGAVPGNSKCVDCGKNDPDWASMNLGVLFCLNCSGIHRHLGSHISKVRSLTMDKWPDGTLRYMKCIGNERANRFWEACMPEDQARLSPTSTQQERTEFITLKYSKRAFVQDKGEEFTSREALNAAMFDFVQKVSLKVDLGSTVSSLAVTASNSPVGTPITTRKESLGDNNGGAGLDDPSSETSDQSSSTSAQLVPVPVEPPRPEKKGGRSSSPLHGLPSSSSDLRRSFVDELIVQKAIPLLPVEMAKDLIWPLYELFGWGAEITAKEPETGKSLTQVLLDKKDPWLLHVFIVHGLEVSQVSEGSSESTLHYCARQNLFECLDIVLAQWGGSVGAALQATNDEGKTPLDLAKENSSFRVLEMLVMREEKERVKREQEEAQQSGSPMRISGQGSNANEHEERKSPRGGKFARAESAAGGMQDVSGAAGQVGDGSGVQKFLKKATGGHMRSKSVFDRPSSGAASLRESTPKIAPFSKMLRKDGAGNHSKRGNNPGLSSRPSSSASPGTDGMNTSSPNRPPVIADEETSPDAGMHPTTPVRSSQKTLGEEVVVREGKNPLMKGKGLDLDAIKEVRESDPSKDERVSVDEAAAQEKDLLAMISDESSEE